MPNDNPPKPNPQGEPAPPPQNDIAEQAEEILEALPEEIRAEVVRAVSFQHFQGPLPPPSILEGYEKILPGSADRIISMTERQQQHRIDMERARLYADIRMEQMGLGAGFVLAVVLAVGGIWLAFEGKELTGFAIFVANIAILVSAFYLTRRRQPQKQREHTPPPAP